MDEDYERYKENKSLILLADFYERHTGNTIAEILSSDAKEEFIRLMTINFPYKVISNILDHSDIPIEVLRLCIISQCTRQELEDIISSGAGLMCILYKRTGHDIYLRYYIWINKILSEQEDKGDTLT